MLSSWDEYLQDLVASRKWKEVIFSGKTISLEQRSRYLWAWPTEECLKFIKDQLATVGISQILSVGCGSGLLEWIIHESTGYNISGVELDNSWWKSSYSPKVFIDIAFAGAEVTEEFLQRASSTTNWNFALLFCYFNCTEAFNRYLNAYKGNFLLIIGPGNNCGRHSDPEPFEPNFAIQNSWLLKNSCEIGNSGDYIAFYSKNIDK